MPSLHIFANNFDRAIEATDEYLEKLPSLELPYTWENNHTYNTHFNRFLSYSHNQQEDFESYYEIDLFAKYFMNVIDYNKASMTGNQYEESKDWLDYNVILLNAWHDILFFDMMMLENLYHQQESILMDGLLKILKHNFHIQISMFLRE